MSRAGSIAILGVILIPICFYILLGFMPFFYYLEERTETDGFAIGEIKNSMTLDIYGDIYDVKLDFTKHNYFARHIDGQGNCLYYRIRMADGVHYAPQNSEIGFLDFSLSGKKQRTYYVVNLITNAIVILDEDYYPNAKWHNRREHYGAFRKHMTHKELIKYLIDVAKSGPPIDENANGADKERPSSSK